ncbi:MAG: acetyltransferase [Clostridia bacterium]|nr:acetyltransferase [Clostridia bacterium]
MEKRDIVVIGAGGLAKEVRWVIEECNKVNGKWNILGWVSKEESGTVIAGLPVLGDDDWLLGHASPIDVVVAVGSGSLRKKIATYLKQNKNISFPQIIAQSAEISKYVKLGEGAVIMNKSILTVDIEAGDFFLCNHGCTVGHDCRFDDYVTLNPGTHISGTVSIGECSSIGVGASVIQGVSIGRNTFIGAGAVVISDIGDNCTAVGVPAKPLEKKI